MALVTPVIVAKELANFPKIPPEELPLITPVL